MALDVQNEDPLPKTHSLVVGLGSALLGHDHDSNGNSTCNDDDDDVDDDGLVTLELFSTNRNKSSSFSYQAQDRVHNLVNTKVEEDRRRRRLRQANRFNPSEKNKRYLEGFLKTMSQRRNNGNNNNNNGNINVPQPKLDLRLNLSPPRSTAAAEAGEGGRRLIMEGPDSPARLASLSPPSSCLSSELINDQAVPVKYSSSPEATSMVLVGCPRCLMYVMLSEDDPKCPKCKSTVLLDFLRDNNATTTAANNNQSAVAAKRTRKS